MLFYALEEEPTTDIFHVDKRAARLWITAGLDGMGLFKVCFHSLSL